MWRAGERPGRGRREGIVGEARRQFSITGLGSTSQPQDWNVLQSANRTRSSLINDSFQTFDYLTITKFPRVPTLPACRSYSAILLFSNNVDCNDKCEGGSSRLGGVWRLCIYNTILLPTACYSMSGLMLNLSQQHSENILPSKQGAGSGSRLRNQKIDEWFCRTLACVPVAYRNSEDIGVLEHMSKKNRRLDFLL